MGDIVITSGTQMLIGRIVTFALSIISAWFCAFRRTPELDEVKNAWIYRVSYAMLILRSLGYIAFDVFGLFPL